MTLGMLLFCMLSCVSAARSSSVTTAAQIKDGDEAPWFCHSIDCPVFKIKVTPLITVMFM